VTGGPHVISLGLGSNLGDRGANLIEAMQSLRAHVHNDCSAKPISCRSSKDFGPKPLVGSVFHGHLSPFSFPPETGR